MTTMTTAFPFYNARGLNAETAHGFISSASIWTQNVYQRCGTAVRSADRHCHPTASASVPRRRVWWNAATTKVNVAAGSMPVVSG